MNMNYEKMWKRLKADVEFDLKRLVMNNTEIGYVDILRMSSSKLIQQSMDNIEKGEDK